MEGENKLVEVVGLKYARTVAETARIMGTSPKTVRKLEARALKKLRTALAKAGILSLNDIL